MKKFILITALFLTFTAFNQLQAQIIYHTGNVFKTTNKLPAEEIVEGKHVNFGVAFEQFGLFWLPVWNYGDVSYALISDDEKTAWMLSEEDVAAIKEEYKLDIPEKPSIPLWHKIGLKPLIVLLVIFLIWAQFSKKEDENEEGETMSK